MRNFNPVYAKSRSCGANQFKTVKTLQMGKKSETVNQGKTVNRTFCQTPVRFCHILLLCVLALLWLWIYNPLFFLKTNICPDAVPPILSFEDPCELTYFDIPSSSFVTTSSKHYKDGFHSLLWRWQPGDRLKLPLGRRLTRGKVGIKIWIYRNQSSDSNLTISLLDSTTPSNQILVIRFNFSLNYQGWRAAWVGIREAESLPRHPGYDQVIIDAPLADIPTKVVFVDLLCLSRDVFKQSRDKIVPPISDKSIYTATSLWQQMYKWSRVLPRPVDGTTPLTENEKSLLKNLTVIEKRLINWFANESIGPSEYTGILKKRWESMVFTGFQVARMKIKELNITLSKEGILTGSPLFAKFSEFGNSQKVGGNKKLGMVTDNILFPLTLEYYFSTRPKCIKSLIAKELKNVNTVSKRKAAVGRMTKQDKDLSELMLVELNALKTPIEEPDLMNILRQVNRNKLETILQLLDYIKDQGWSEGSGFGSLDHEMNRVGMGFMNSLFLLKPDLEQRGRLDDILNTMKWYNEFGEMYQTNFEFNGTSADRMRTIFVYRLQTILMNPSRTIKEQREKLRDMAAYKRWCDHALLVNSAFEGVFKPDLSCFHHLAIYGPAYSPAALTKAAMVNYLLDGTSFALNRNSRRNIKERLDNYQIMAVLYSLPNSIAGRFPGYFKPILITMLPAYSYLSVAPQYLTDNGTLQPVTLGSDEDMIASFLRLYDPENPNVVNYLTNGKIGPVDEYLYSLGALEVMEAVYSKAKQANVTAKASPVGHWVRGYAALSIHRRGNWVVSLKGFNRYIWDYESSETQNRYGLYASHGALQISNSEDSLLAYDVENGWDWTRIPGTTTIKMNLEQMPCLPTARNYQQSKLVGGVSIISKDQRNANGGFAMRFRQPRYGYHTSYKGGIEFSFKKTVFFFNDLVVSLATDIEVDNSYPNKTQTTLFQDKLVEPSASSTIYINGVTKWLYYDSHMRIDDSTAMLDTNGNGYYVPSGQPLNVEISDQYSKTSNGSRVSTARYATAWLDHGVNPSGVGYEYAILVATNAAGIESLKAEQSSPNPRYVVIQKDTRAHVIGFTEKDSSGMLYGYAFYDPQAVTDGPVRSVSAECIVMAEIDAPNFSNINVSISSPDLNFNTSKVLNVSEDNGLSEYFYMGSRPVNVTVNLRQSVQLDIQRVLVNGKDVEKSMFGRYVEVEPEFSYRDQGGDLIVFKYLVNGESVEAFLIATTDLELKNQA